MLGERRQRNTAIFGGIVLLGAAAFALSGKLAFKEPALVYQIGKLGYYRVAYLTVAALAALLLLTGAPAAWLKRTLAPVGKMPVLAPGAILTLGGGSLALQIWPYWPFFVMGAILAGALFWLLRREACQSADRALAWCGRARAFPVLVAAFTAAATFLLSHGVYNGDPHVSDSCARYAHILMLSKGHWSFPPPPDWQWAVSAYMIDDGIRFCSQYQPGILLVGLLSHLLGSDSLVPALLAGGVALLTYLVGRRVYDKPTAALGAVLLALSGNFLFLACSFMEHTPATFFLMAALWLGLRDLERPRWGNAWVLGFCVGFACITRSVTALGWAGPMLAIWWVMRWRRWRWAGLPAAAVALVGWLVPMAFFLYFNAQTTGDATIPGFWATRPDHHSLGFTADNGHTPLLGLVYQWNNIWSLSQWLFFWPATSYLFIVALFLLAKWERRDTVMMVPFVGLAGIHFFYTYQDFDFSPRFLSESIPLLALVTARGILAATDYLRQTAPSPAGRIAWRRTMLAGIVVLFVLALSPVWGQFAREHRDQESGVEALAQLLAPFHMMPDATVFVDDNLYAHRALIDEVECWGGARFLQAPNPEMRAKYVCAHPERRCYLVWEYGEVLRMRPDIGAPGSHTSISYQKVFGLGQSPAYGDWPSDAAQAATAPSPAASAKRVASR